MTLISLHEDEVGPGAVNTPRELTFIEATIRQGCQISSHIEQ